MYITRIEQLKFKIKHAKVTILPIMATTRMKESYENQYETMIIIRQKIRMTKK